MTTLASQLLPWALVTLVAYLAWRHINRPRQPEPHWTLDDLVSKRAESGHEAEWAEAYVTWRIDQIHGRGPYDQEADS